MADISSITLPNGETYNIKNTTYATATTAAAGLMPMLSGSTVQYLNGNGSWGTPPNTTYAALTTTQINNAVDAAFDTPIPEYANGVGF